MTSLSWCFSSVTWVTVCIQISQSLSFSICQMGGKGRILQRVVMRISGNSAWQVYNLFKDKCRFVVNTHVDYFSLLTSFLSTDSSSIWHDAYKVCVGGGGCLPIPHDSKLHATQGESVAALSWNVLDLKQGFPSLIRDCEVQGYRKVKKMKTCGER